MLLFCFVIFSPAVLGVSLPSYLTKYTCSRSSPVLNQCLKDNFNAAIREVFPKGIPELKVPAKDPWRIPYMRSIGDVPGLNVNLTMYNTSLIGWRNLTIRSFRFDPKKLSGQVKFRIPAVRMLTTYSAIGNLFAIPLTSDAKFSGKFYDYDVALKFKLGTQTLKGKTYFNIQSLNFNGDLDDATIRITAEDDQQGLVNVIENFFNNNVELVWNTMYPVFRDTASYFFKYWLGRALLLAPAEELLPE